MRGMAFSYVSLNLIVWYVERHLYKSIHDDKIRLPQGANERAQGLRQCNASASAHGHDDAEF